MAVGVLITMPELTEEQYEQTNRRIFGHYPIAQPDAPEGLVVHSAGPVPEGWYVYDIWDSKEDFQRFGRERIEPAVRAVTGRDFHEQDIQFFEVASFLSGEPAIARV